MEMNYRELTPLERVHEFGHRAAIDFNQEENYFSGHIEVASYLVTKEKMYIWDTVWGDEAIGDQKGDELLIELANHDALKRLSAVEQLTLTKRYITNRNTSSFSRWEHIWGSIIPVRRLARKYNISEEDSLKLQLRTLLSDIGHSTGSHLGDWTFQGFGGSEDLHDLELLSYLEKTGINDILRKHNIKPEDVIFPKIEDWIECPQPFLCIDRLDYALREMKRWLPMSYNLEHFFNKDNLDNLEIVDNQLVITNKDLAKEFAELYLELNHEHWNDKVHKLQLALYIARAKRVIADDHGSDESWLDYHPRDVLYCSDPEFELAMREHDPFGYALDTIMTNIASYERNIGWHMRQERIRMRRANSKYGQLLNFEDDAGLYNGYLKHHPMLSFSKSNEETSRDVRGFEFDLPALKTRYIDPLVKNGNSVQRLSDVDPYFQVTLGSFRLKMAESYIAKIAIADKGFDEELHEQLRQTNLKWQESMSRPRMSETLLKEHITNAARLAILYSFVNIHYES